MASKGVDAMWFLPSALNVKVMKFKQARVNGGSNYDSLNEPRGKKMEMKMKMKMMMKMKMKMFRFASRQIGRAHVWTPVTL